MKLYRLKVMDYGQYGDRGLKMLGPGLSAEAFTVRADALKAYNRQLKTFIDGNYRYSIRLDLVETPQMDSDLWRQYVATGLLPLTVLEVIRSARGAPDLRYAA